MKWNRKALGTSALLSGSGLAVSAALLIGIGTVSPPRASADPQFPRPPADGQIGFILTDFSPAIRDGNDQCPDGVEGGLKENYLATLPDAERTRLLVKTNEPELTSRWKAWGAGPDHANACNNPELFDHQLKSVVHSKISYGLNLDNDASGHPAGGCDHEDFSSPDGEAGIDNQAYRALGCTRGWRQLDGKAGDVSALRDFLANGVHTMVLLLRGVDSLKDDPDVEVIFASTEDRPILDSQRHFITDASYTVSANPRWRNVLKGSIHDGVLTTAPVDMLLNQKVGHGGIRGRNNEWDLRRGRLRLKFQPDGSVSGLLGAYIPPRVLISQQLLGGWGSVNSGIDCSASYNTMMRMADGVKDPKTGKCTALSAAMQVSAVPAFINDRPPAGDRASR